MITRRHQLALLAVACGLAAGAQAQSDTVKIGVILPMTGQQASTGRQVAAGIKLWMAQHGDKAGGKKVEVLIK
ncbi:MAG: ABC transporter substrate-binding protein, partial [Burkholderiales bacterium]|nr:ABC transporter substrate-binding protein [Burkholderiales bacterium]